jgi:transcriptional regulator with XRE-family HTH domain
MIIMSLFSKNLRYLRKKGNHNQDEIALLFNKRANTIGNWENQKSEPSLEELMKLGDFFNLGSGDLLQRDLEMEFTGARRQESQIPEGQFPANDNKPEPRSSQVREGEPDGFWLVLRELRALHEKVDLLVSRLESSSLHQHTDKSYY